MSETALTWLVRAALGGGLVLLVAWWRVRRIESPARRQRLAEGALVAALFVALLGLAPHWISVRLPSWQVAQPAPAVPQPETVPPAEEPPFEWPAFVFEPLDEPIAEVAPPAPVAAAKPDAPVAINWDVFARLVVSAYALVAATLLAWWLAGHVALWWTLRRRGAVPERLATLFDELAAGRRVRLLISPRVRVPFSCGLLWPTVVIPCGLARRASLPELRWVLRHELRHLERGDPLSAWLFGIGQSLFFYLPWFWWLRHEVRLCQEYLADQAAVEAGGDRVEYADFLAGWAASPGLPAGVPSVGGTGRGSDLLRRIRMLLDRHVLESRCPRGWLLGVIGVLMAAAVLLAGVGPAALADNKPSAFAADDFDAFAAGAKKEDKTEKDKTTKKDDKDAKKEDKKDKKKDDKEKPKDKERMSFLDVDELLKKLPADLDEKQIEAIKQQLDAAKRQVEQAMKMAEQLRKNPQFFERVPFRAGGSRQEGGRLGVRFSVPSATLAEQLDLPKNQGLVIEDVRKDSPAAKVGLKVNDVLLEVNGKPVANTPEGFAKQVESLEANRPVDVVVLRKGKKETLKGLTLPEVKVDRPSDKGGSMVNLTRTGDQFTVFSRDGGKMIQVRGKLSDGKAQLTSVQLTQGKQSVSFASLDKVPKESQDEVKALLALAEKSAATGKAKQ
jgi:beta-lactamase regulating signal transducer with metallopeptidase domain